MNSFREFFFWEIYQGSCFQVFFLGGCLCFQGIVLEFLYEEASQQNQKQSLEVFQGKSVLKKFSKLTEKLLFRSLFFNEDTGFYSPWSHQKTSGCLIISGEIEACIFIKKETPEQMFFCEFWKSFENISFEEHLRVAASGKLNTLLLHCQHQCYRWQKVKVR